MVFLSLPIHRVNGIALSWIWTGAEGVVSHHRSLAMHIQPGNWPCHWQSRKQSSSLLRPARLHLSAIIRGLLPPPSYPLLG
jgi:hypothetical protein